MRALVWLLRALIFFTLFAFALNNQQDAVVRWFFGVEWRAPMVIIVLAALLCLGCRYKQRRGRRYYWQRYGLACSQGRPKG